MSEPESRTTERRWYDVHVPGFDVEAFYAESRAKARAAAVRALREAGYRTALKASVRLSADQGDPRTPEFGVAP